MNTNSRGHRIAAQDKHLLSLHKEHRKLLNVQRSAPLIELDEPYQRGWVRFFRLRDDASRREDAETLKEILDEINVYQYCRKGTFTQKNKKTGVEEPIGHNPKKYNVKEWCLYKWPPIYHKYFEIRLVTERNWRNQLVRNQRYVFKYPFYFVSHIEKHFVTHQRVGMPEIDARLAEIEDCLYQQDIQGRLDNLLGFKYRWHPQRVARSTANYQAVNEGLEELADE